MTHLPDCTLSPDLLGLIADQGLDALPELMRIVINQAMQAERQQHLQAAPSLVFKLWGLKNERIKS